MLRIFGRGVIDYGGGFLIRRAGGFAGGSVRGRCVLMLDSRGCGLMCLEERMGAGAGTLVGVE